MGQSEMGRSKILRCSAPLWGSMHTMVLRGGIHTTVFQGCPRPRRLLKSLCLCGSTGPIRSALELTLFEWALGVFHEEPFRRDD